MSFRPENEARDEASYGSSGRRLLAEVGLYARFGSRPGLVILVGLLLVALMVGVFLLWRSYGDRAGGTSVFEDSVESGSEPIVHLTTGLGQVHVEGAEGLENVEVSAERYARGSNPSSAKENADEVPVSVDNDGSAVEISFEGGRGTGADFSLKVPSGSAVEIESTAGNVEVSGLDNDVTVDADGGDVSIEDVRGSVAVEAPRGDVTVKRVTTETGDAELTVGSGDIELRDLVLGILEANAEAGNVTLSGRFSGSGKVSVETGSINVKLPPEDTKNLDLQTRVGQIARDDEQGSGG